MNAYYQCPFSAILVLTFQFRLPARFINNKKLDIKTGILTSKFKPKMLIWVFVLASVSAHFHEGFTNGGKPGGGGGGGGGGGNKNKNNNNNNNGGGNMRQNLNFSN
jgi:hypothetical protein